MQNITKISSFMDSFTKAESNNIHRIGILSVEGVIDIIREIESLEKNNKAAPMIDVYNILIDSHSVKLYTFVKHGTTCKCCGISGCFFAVEYDKNDNEKNIILNLYSIDKNEKEVLMNADHRIPKYHGGSNGIDNMQTMCQPCNIKKGHKLIYTDGGILKKKLKK